MSLQLKILAYFREVHQQLWAFNSIQSLYRESYEYVRFCKSMTTNSTFFCRISICSSTSAAAAFQCQHSRKKINGKIFYLDDQVQCDFFVFFLSNFSSIFRFAFALLRFKYVIGLLFLLPVRISYILYVENFCLVFIRVYFWSFGAIFQNILI